MAERRTTLITMDELEGHHPRDNISIYAYGEGRIQYIVKDLNGKITLFGLSHPINRSRVYVRGMHDSITDRDVYEQIWGTN